MVRLKHDEIAELLGAYALDAVEPDEAQVIDSHLAVCPRCRDEVREHREVSALLAYSGAAAPPGLWDRLAAALDEGSPPVDAPVLAPVSSIAAARSARVGRPSHRSRAVLGVAAALLIAIGLVGGLRLQSTLDRQTDQIGDIQSAAALSQAALSASSTPGSRTVHLSSSKAGMIADAVITPDGQAYLWNVQLPELGEGRTYQLWAIVGTEPANLGVLGSKPGVSAFRVSPQEVGALAITEEAAGGAKKPTSSPILVGAVPTEPNVGPTP